MKLIVLKSLMLLGAFVCGVSGLEEAPKEELLVFEYKIQEPSEPSISGKSPAVILLHGLGSHENDLFALKDRLPKNYYVISARAPFERRPGSYAWYQVDLSTGKAIYDDKEAAQSREMIAEFIDQLIAKYPIDSDEVHLLGFSQGAFMSFSVAIHYPEKVRSILAMSGRILEEDQKVLESVNSIDVDIAISHSASDRVLPISHAYKAEELLKTKASSFKFLTHNQGHRADLRLLQELD